MMNTRMGAIGVGLAILLSLCGMTLTALLLDYHVETSAGDQPLVQPWCERGQFSCTEALDSSWARVPFNRPADSSIPTALLGFIYFTAVSAWYLIVGRPSGSRYNWHWFAVLMTVAGAAGAGFLTWKAVGMSKVCLPCAAAQAIAGLLLVLTLMLWPRRRLVAVMAEPVSGPVRGPLPVRVPAPDYPPARVILAWVLTTAGVSTLGWLAYDRALGAHPVASSPDQSVSRYQQEAEQARTEAVAAKAQAKSADEQRTALAAELETTKAALAEAQKAGQETAARLKDYEDDYQAVWFNFMNEPQLDVPVDQSDSIRGKVDALHTIVMYADMQCPYCQGADKVLKQKLAKFPDQLRLVVKHYPLDKTCNPNVTGSLHPAACPAAVTLEAARAVGGEEAFWRMYDELFAHQAEFAKSPKEFVKAACERIGISNDELWQKINTKSVWNRVNQHTEQAARNGVDGTPTVFYDGRKVAGWANSKFWDFIMWREAQGAGTTPAPQPAPQATQPAAPPATQPQ